MRTEAELETNIKNRNIIGLHKGINRYQQNCQPRTYLVTEENSDLLAGFHHMEENFLSVIECT